MSTAPDITQLNLDVEAFVTHYWQKKPCLLRNALPGFETLISPEELAGLACEEDVHCRLVMQGDSERDWRLRYGPFSEQDFLDLPESHYSLLVSECEKWLPELNDVLARFRFIPDWRIDDLMISYAPAGGSVGPHVDQYDVFLLQALGSRRWQYCDQPSADEALVPNLELAILQNFKPQQEAVLNPGDILYLPPGFAHHGVAEDRCMTYSIGFRAPTVGAIVESLLLESELSGAGESRYCDPDLELNRHHAELSDADIKRFRKLVTQLIDGPSNLLHDAVGKMLSDSDVATPEEQPAKPLRQADIETCEWIRHPQTRLLFHRFDDAVAVYCNGHKFSLPCAPELVDALQNLCENHHWSDALLRDALAVPELAEWVVELANQSAILPILDE